MKVIFTFTLAILVLSSCKVNDINEVSLYTKQNNMIKVSENFFIDKYRVTNSEYVFYILHCKREYGIHSEEYKSVLPIKYNENRTYYLHPEYASFPVTGITYDQIISFNNWRSNMEMEKFLINTFLKDEKSKEKYFSKPRSFTIDKYFKGEFEFFKPHENIEHFPSYQVPSKEEYEKYKSIIDDLANEELKKLSKKMKSSKFPNEKERKSMLYILDNFSEYTKDKNEFYNSKDFNKSKYFGFRNSLKFIKWVDN